MSPREGADADALRRTLFGLPGVVSAQPIEALATSLRDVVAQLTDVLNVVAVIALILAVLIAYNSATISQDERTREVATMLAFGLPVRRVMASAVTESALIGLVGTAIGIIGGFVHGGLARVPPVARVDARLRSGSCRQPPDTCHRRRSGASWPWPWRRSSPGVA